MVTLRKLCYKLALASTLLGLVSIIVTAIVTLFMVVFMPGQVTNSPVLGAAVVSGFALAMTGGLLSMMLSFDREL